MDLSNLKTSVLWYTMLSLPFIGVMTFVIVQPITVLPRIALSPGYVLVDEVGERLTSEDQRGRLTLYNFSYASCTEPCEQMNDTMAQVQHAITSQSPTDVPVDLITVSVDAVRDTPNVLRQFAASLNADSDYWHFATGDPNQLKQMIGGNFNTYYAPQNDGGFELDPAFILVDGWGVQRAEYREPEPDLAIIQRDINLLLQESKNSEGITKYAYEAAHLFLCYP